MGSRLCCDLCHYTHTVYTKNENPPYAPRLHSRGPREYHIIYINKFEKEEQVPYQEYMDEYWFSI
jgi:hypothetical protein